MRELLPGESLAAKRGGSKTCEADQNVFVVLDEDFELLSCYQKHGNQMEGNWEAIASRKASKRNQRFKRQDIFQGAL